MVEGFKKGFYSISSYAKKEGKKQETTSWQSSSSLLQPFSYYQQPGIQQKEQKKAQKSKYTETPTSTREAQKTGKVCFKPGGVGIQSFWSDEHETAHLSCTKSLKEVKRLKKDNDKLMENLSKQDEIESRLMSQERELSAFWNISQSKNCQSQNQQQKQTDLGNKLGEIEEKLQQQMKLNEQKGDPMLVQVIDKKKKTKPIKVVKRETPMKKIGVIPKLQEAVLKKIKETASVAKEKETIITKENQRETIHELAWKNLQEETFADDKKMLEGFKSGFYTTSSQAKKEGRKLETKSQQSQQSTLSQLQPTLNQQLGIQQNERKPTLKNIHMETPTSSKKPRKQMKSVLHQSIRVQAFWPDEHGVAHQSCTEPPGRGQEIEEGQ